MNTTTRALVFCAPVLMALGLNVRAAEPAFKNDKEKLSYAVGMNVAVMMKMQDVEVDPDLAAQGLRDSLARTNGRMTEDEARILLSKYRMELGEKQRQKTLALMRKNTAEEAAFMATNKNNPGVITLPDGLQYKVIKNGTGESPKREEIVRLNYRGTLLDGTEFENSMSRFGKPVPHAVNSVIPAWTEALMMMKPGAKWKLYVPSGLAYRDYGGPQPVGPNAALLYDLELVSIEKTLPASTTPMSSDVVKVPSFEEMQKGAKVEMIKASEVEKLEKQYQEDLKKADEEKRKAQEKKKQ